METTKVFGNPDGTLSAEVYMEPIHYLYENRWVDINNTLEVADDGKSFTNRANKFKVSFPKNPKEKEFTRLFDYSIAGKEITFGLSNTQSDNPKLLSNPQDTVGEFKDNKAKFVNLYPGVTFNYSVDGSKVKEDIILESYQGKNSFKFEIKGTGIKASKKSNGSIEFLDKSTGKYLFNIPRPYMFDSNKQAGPEGVSSQEVNQDITPTKDGFILTITADEAFLTDKATVYPVTIDPWIDYFNAQDTYIASAYPNTNYYNTSYLYVGHDATIVATRSLVKWPTLPDIPNAEVLGGQIGFYQYHAYSQVAPVGMHKVISGWAHDQVKWSTQPSFNSSAESTLGSLATGYNYFEATNLIKDWYANPQTNYGVIFKYADSQEYSNTRRTFYSSDWINPDGTPVGKPKLVISFRSKEFLGLADYWKFTPDIFQGEGTGVVNVINGNFVYDIPVLDLNSRVNAFNLKMVYNSRSSYQDAWGAKAVDEKVLMDAFVRMFNRIYENRDAFIETMTANIEMIILQRPNIGETEASDHRIEELKNELKKLIRFQVSNNIDAEVYNEEYKNISGELGEVRKKRLELDKVNDLKDGLKQRFDEIVQTINNRDSFLEEFDDEIFNALVEKIEILTPTHIVFELKSGMRVRGDGGGT